ncbi:hypothetical protein D020_4311 [Vibrio parahaemolyticus SBR10290]|nr:hypothetical protein D020_4311 [Vibrio parahaemolyticus SBR10290]
MAPLRTSPVRDKKGWVMSKPFTANRPVFFAVSVYVKTFAT